MELKSIEYECIRGNKIVLSGPWIGFLNPPPCKVCGRYGVFTVRDGELYYQRPDFLMQEFECLGLKKDRIKGIF